MEQLQVIRDLPRSPDESDGLNEYRHKCRQAAVLSIKKGILQADMPVLDLFCGNPYTGLYQVLRRSINWCGLYVGLDRIIPQAAVEAWHRREKEDDEHQVLLKSYPGGPLPLPPVDCHPYKEIGVAFCVDAFDKLPPEVDKRTLVLYLKDTAAQIIIAGGATLKEFDEWEFQTTGTYNLVPFGIWMDDNAVMVRITKNRLPPTSMGFFAHTTPGGQGMIPKTLGICEFCGKIDATGKSKFECIHCGKVTSIRRMKHGD